jgi:hypothetical protein
MQKKIVKNGKVAVLVSPDFGAGWYSWHHIEALLFDPIVVDMVERAVDTDTIIAYCETTYDSTEDKQYYGGASKLQVRWIPDGSYFRIDEYDGSESLILKDDEKWITA